MAGARMTADFLIKISPIIGGTILIAVCLIAILRNPGVSNTFAVLLAFGALLFVIPALSIFNFKGMGIEISGQATTEQVTQQAASINARLEDIKLALADLGKRIAPAAAPTPPPSAEFGANRSQTVIVVYSAAQKALAKQLENELLKKGYQATSVYSDYSELADARKGPPGSVRFLYSDATKSVGESVKQLLKADTGGLTLLPDEVRPQMSADAQILLF
jgi:hypothetical protein